jgi:hypothetical protein
LCERGPGQLSALTFGINYAVFDAGQLARWTRGGQMHHTRFCGGELGQATVETFGTERAVRAGCL